MCVPDRGVSYERSTLRRFGPAVAALPYPLFALALLPFAALTLSPATQVK